MNKPTTDPIETSNETPALQVHGLSYRYHDAAKPAIDDLHLAIPTGRHTAIIGPNGGGKSTLLLHLAGLLPNRCVHVFGRQAWSRTNLKWIRRRVGLLFQNPDDQLFMPTVREDVAFGPLNFKMPNAQQAATDTLSDMGLTELADRAPYHLSGGEKHLVALAAVMAYRPPLLLLDEPTSSLDPGSRRRVMYRLADVMNQSVTVVAATHDLDMVYELFDRVVLLDQGRCRADGPCADILADKNFLASCDLEVPLSILLARCRNGSAQGPVDEHDDPKSF